MTLLLPFVNIVLALLLAPILNGLIKTTKARWQSRQGPSILQPWFDILKYIARESVTSEHASWVFSAAPYVYFAAHLIAATLLPLILLRDPIPGLGDAIVIVGLLAVARFALALAALDTASNFGGMGTSRELAFAALVEPALMLALFALAIPAQSTAIAALAGDGSLTAAKVLALVALLVVAIAETGRLPVDNPDTHLELTMAHEGMLLEYSGRPLALLLWATHVKQLVILSLIAALFLPWGMASNWSAMAVTIGLGTYVLKLAVLGLVLAFVETVNVKMRIFRIPELLGAASLFGGLAVASIYVVGG